MSTHSLPSLKDSSLAPDKSFVPRRDLRSSSTAASSPTDMSSVVVPRSFPDSSGQIAEGGSSVVRVEQAPSPGGSRYDQGQEATRGGKDGRVAAPVSSSGDRSALPSVNNTPTHPRYSDIQCTGGLGDEQANTAAVPAPAQSSDGQPVANTPAPVSYPQKVDGRQDEQEHVAALGASGHSSDGQNPVSSNRLRIMRSFMDIQYQLGIALLTHNEGTDRPAPRGEEADNGQPIRVDVGAQTQTSVGAPKHVDEARQFNPMKEDYEQIFPEDPYGEEAGPNARVFKVYNEEAATYDEDMIGQCGDSSDVLLIFAGLFSAVLTTFVAQTSQALETDKIAVSNSMLSEIVHLLRAQENGTSFGEVAPAITETSPSGNDLWVNGLWFTSLTLSLATALFAVLTKQWLRQYRMKTSGTIRDRSLIRQFHFAGMKKWHVVTIIGILPILLHLALGVFLVGLSVFLIPRSLPLACIVSVITVVIFSLYFVSNLLPVLHIQCPYRTPFSDILNILAHLHLPIDTQNSLISALNSICKHLNHMLL